MAERRRYSALSEDTYDDYSDDFQSDIDEESPVKSAPEKRRSPPTRGYTYASEAHSVLRSGGRVRGHGRGRGRGRGQGGRHSQAKSETQIDVVTKRLLSASRLKMNELQNQVEDMKKQMKVVVDENKLFKRMQHKQERALEKFEDRESELPMLIQAHNNEVRSLKEQLRRTREKYDKTDRYLRDAEDELESTKGRLKKYKALSDQKELAERNELDRRLNKAELEVEERESRVKELTRHLEMLKKNHRHELGIERAHFKDAQKQLEEIKERNSKLETLLKEKEKMLEAKNIYSNRFLKPSSYSGTPAESPSPWRPNLKKKSESLTDLTPRDKAKAYEEKRKEEEKKKLRLPKLPNTSRKPLDRPQRKQEPKQKWEEENREKDTEETPNGPNFVFNSLPRQDSEADFWRRQEERYKQDKVNKQKQELDQRRRKADEEDKEQSRFREQRQKLQRDMEERERAERERKEADERERKNQEERERWEREEREQREREERERREREERERMEAEQREQDRKEQDRKVKEAQERLDNDPRLAEERRKKEELLRRLQQMDANRDGSQPSSDPFAPSDSTRARGGGDSHSDPFAPSPSRRAGKDPFSLSPVDSNDSTPSSKKDYTFKRSVENMHKGKPAHEDVSVPYIDRQKKIKAAKDEAEVGGYQPSFVSPGKTTTTTQKKPLSLFDDSDSKSAARPAAGGQDKKAKLLADLFGSQAAPSSSAAKKDESEEFFVTNKSPARQQTQPKRNPGFPWDDPVSTSKTNGSAHRESSTLFGGGAALVDDDVGGTGGKSSTMLPRRTRQPSNTISSRPAMMVVDNLEDDGIEEVIL